MKKKQYKAIEINRPDICCSKRSLGISSFLIGLGLLCSLSASAIDVYKWGTANGTRFYLKVEDPERKTAQVHASAETDYRGDIVIPEKIITDDGEEYTIDLIDKEAFMNNKNITSISIPKTVTEIGQYTFSGCTSLKSVILGEGTARIYKYAFENCTGIETITFPISTLYFEKETFKGCENITEVYLYDDDPRGITGNDPFELIGSKATLFVPYGTEDEYATLYGWKDFTVKPFLVLDETKTLTLTNRVENIRTIFNRSIKSGKWNSFCVPFSLSSEDIVTIFGKGTRILEFDPTSTETTLNFIDAVGITANKPCLINPVQGWNTYTFKELTIDPSGSLAVPGINYDFTGNYSYGYVPTGSYFISNNFFYKAVDGTDKLKGYRAYITPVNGGKGTRQMEFTISSTTADAARISNIRQNEPAGIYDISGHLLLEKVGSAKELRKGIYIRGNKKILIK